jgi:hypothetical protein
MKRKHVVFVTGLLIAIAIPVGLLLYKSKRTETLDEYLAGRGFSRVSCATPIMRSAAEATCYAGSIGRVSATLAFITQYTAGYNPNASHVASRVAVVIDLALPDGSTDTRRYEEVWTASDAHRRLAELQKELER